jgi:hypothetical protein
MIKRNCYVQTDSHLRQIVGGDASGSFSPLAPEELKRWARNWGDLLFEMENGLINDGAAI